MPPPLPLNSEPRYDERYVEYVELFNERQFYECHEVLEDLWLDNDGPDRKFYQGLIQMAAAYLHLWRGNMAGFTARLRSTIGYLAPYPDHHEGLDVATLRRAAEAWLDRVATEGRAGYVDDDVPRIRLEEPA